MNYLIEIPWKRIPTAVEWDSYPCVSHDYSSYFLSLCSWLEINRKRCVISHLGSIFDLSSKNHPREIKKITYNYKSDLNSPDTDPVRSISVPRKFENQDMVIYTTDDLVYIKSELEASDLGSAKLVVFTGVRSKLYSIYSFKNSSDIYTMNDNSKAQIEAASFILSHITSHRNKKIAILDHLSYNHLKHLKLIQVVV